MDRTFKYYLQLSKKQKQNLEEVLGICCWFYNYLLEQYRLKDENKQKQLTEYQLINFIP